MVLVLGGAGLRIFKTRPFARYARSERIGDYMLCEAVRRAMKGLIDADMGGGVIKQRIARKGQGRSGGYRSIVLFREGMLAFFVYGFAKRDRDNIRQDELGAFRALAREMLNLDEAGLKAAIANETIVEVVCNGKTVQE